MNGFEIEALVGLAAIPVVVYGLTEHIKGFINAVRDFQPVGKNYTEWPLVADGIGALYALGAWYSGWIPSDQVDSPLGAVLVGLVASLVVQKGYDQLNGK